MLADLPRIWSAPAEQSDDRALDDYAGSAGIVVHSFGVRRLVAAWIIRVADILNVAERSALG